MKLSEYFASNIGVRQGESLSPVMVILFINHMKEYISNYYKGLNIPGHKIFSRLEMDGEIDIYLNLYLI